MEVNELKLKVDNFLADSTSVQERVFTLFEADEILERGYSLLNEIDNEIFSLEGSKGRVVIIQYKREDLEAFKNEIDKKLKIFSEAFV